jgi:hypothetical protein
MASAAAARVGGQGFLLKSGCSLFPVCFGDDAVPFMDRDFLGCFQPLFGRFAFSRFAQRIPESFW